jgi:uncharacterized delta-60 repeat protein
MIGSGSKTLAFFASACLVSSGAAKEGDLDATFGNGGQIYTPLSPSLDRANAVAIQRDGKILVGGSRGDQQFATVRYDGSNGSVDTSFGAGGVAITDVSLVAGGGPASISALRVLADGKILAAGSSYNSQDFSRTTPTLARYNEDGSLDQGFGANGLVIMPVAGMAAAFRAIAVQPDGKIVVAGWAQWGSVGTPLLARFDTAGTLDPSFGNAGVVQDDSLPMSAASAIVQESDGTFLVLGGSSCQIALTHFFASGERDHSFGNDGNAVTTKSGVCIGGTSMAIQRQQVVVAGTLNNAGHFSALLGRYNIADGSLDTTFGNEGFSITTLSGNQWFYTGDFDAQAVSVLANEKIVIAGGTRNSSISNFTLACYLCDGALDSAFGFAGIVNSFGTTNQFFNAMAVQQDGKIVAAGAATVNGQFAFGTARYLSAPGDLVFEGAFEETYCSH